MRARPQVRAAPRARPSARPSQARKAPRQERSRAMVDAILDAAADVLRDDGFDAATTNRVAARAGVSVGSLYQYYPNKLALVRALVERHDAAMWRVFVHQAATALGQPFTLAIPRVIDALFEAHRVDPVLHRVLHQQAAHVGGDLAMAETMARSRAVLEDMLRARADQHALADEIPIAARVVVEAVEALIHASIEVTVDEATALQRHASRLVLAYLGCTPVAAAAASSSAAASVSVRRG